ncbi:MAG TPA: DinB family protein [Roseiflexaceae bacterium]|nr:DinB family protein [Roseiflexaceae bacterium]
MNKQILNVLFAYNRWANARILEAAAKLSTSQFVAAGDFPHGGLRGTLVHTLFAEWVWRLRWQGAAPSIHWRPEDFPSLASLRARWRAEEMQLMEFIDGLPEQRLMAEFDYISTEGDPHRRVVWETMLHLVNHGTQHRSEAAAILTAMGQSPGDIDLVVFLNEGSG